MAADQSHLRAAFHRVGQAKQATPIAGVKPFSFFVVLERTLGGGIRFPPDSSKMAARPVSGALPGFGQAVIGRHHACVWTLGLQNLERTVFASSILKSLHISS
jgi:hypothetical protein